MSWKTNKMAIGLRNIGRRIGLNSFIMSVISQKDYEDKFNNAMLSNVKKGDVVWDVGANVGLYTKIFSDLVDSRGKVLAFEPSPNNLTRLEADTKSIKNIELLPFGLGNREEIVNFMQGDDELGATSQVVNDAPISGKYDKVEIRVGDKLVQSGVVAPPNFIKIDVEGFELEVLMGMSEILGAQTLRALGIEIHFGLLAARQMEQAPRQIELLLEDAGFKCSWPDNSHILALRPI